MNSSQPNPQLPTWIFIVTDLALLGAATAIAVWSAHPLSNQAILWIVACVVLGAAVLLVPLVANYERQKNEALDERQCALEALARTVSSSAEQISIAASGLNGVAELAQKNLRLAEQLPHKLHEKIAEFHAQLAAAEDTEKEELERELLALRTLESERLETVSQRIAKSAAEWSKLEAATQQQLAAANDALAKLSLGTASAIGKAQAAAEQALAQARVEAARVIGDASGTAVRTIETAKNAALTELDTRVNTLAASVVDRIASDLNTRLAQLPAVTATFSHAAVAPDVSAPSASMSATAAPAISEPEAPKSDALAQPPKRPRKIRREEPAAPASESATATTPSPETASAPAGSSPADSASLAPTPTPTAAAPATPPPAEEPPPVPTNAIPEITPAVPDTAEPFSGHLATTPNGTSNAPHAVTAETSASPENKSPRKRAPKKTEPDDEPGLGLELEETSMDAPGAIGERGLTSDGATRLLVTAYIGIGNRMFIRGNGPGLSWDKGVPLQFVSIGKWRWETNDATGPVTFKLYKNDELECTALGAHSLEPGHQQEVTAAF